ncbi:type II secretion system protein GspL [Thiomicrorhabdus sp.]|uniref:type II secretion system protein GspL n=1 Tax=Thiomicrorhabdus sp. TaxID=2039724 RepID=UPI0029C6C0F8|nr:type II secretion system protein GspL [Thiomicrorhabdus sp.]
MLRTKVEQTFSSPSNDETSAELSAVVYFSTDGQLYLQRGEENLVFNSAFPDMVEGARFLKQLKTVWVPSEQVILTEITVPGKRRSDWLAALPYALEERLSAPVEHYHFVPLKRFSDGRTQVAVVTHTLMQAWVETLQAIGGGHLQLVADCFRLPEPSENHWNRVREEGRCLLRSGVYQGFGALQGWFDPLLYSANQQVGSSTTEIDELLSDDLANSSSRIDAVLNLRVGPYGGKHGYSGMAKIWGWPLGAVAALLVISMLDTSIQTSRLQEQAQSYKQQSHALFKQLFPQTKRIINIKSQTLSNLKQQSGGGSDTVSFMPWLHQIETLVQPGKGVKIDKLDWSLKQKQLSFYLQASKTESLQVLETQAKQRLQNAQVRLQLKTVTPQLVEGILYVAAP